MRGVYSITNTVNSKVYIGSSVNIKQRFRRHKHDLLHNKHGNKHLQSSFNKHGLENFEFKIIECCEDCNLQDLENFYISDLSPEYNQKQFSEHRAGYIQSQLAIENKSKAMKKMSRNIDGNKNTHRRGLCKPISLYSLEGEFLSEYPCQKDLIEEQGGSKAYLATVLSKNKLYYKGKIVKYSNSEITEKDIFKAKEIHLNEERKGNRLKVQRRED